MPCEFEADPTAVSAIREDETLAYHLPTTTYHSMRTTYCLLYGPKAGPMRQKYGNEIKHLSGNHVLSMVLFGALWILLIPKWVIKAPEHIAILFGCFLNFPEIDHFSEIATFFKFFHETHVLVSCRVYIGTFDQRSAKRPPERCLTSPCCRDFIFFRIFAAQILVPLYVSLTRRHFGAFFGEWEISVY